LYSIKLKENLKGIVFGRFLYLKMHLGVGRKLLNLRSIAKPFIKHMVGDGSSIFLWFDN
jgi:hypothetical protein